MKQKIKPWQVTVILWVFAIGAGSFVGGLYVHSIRESVKIEKKHLETLDKSF